MDSNSSVDSYIENAPEPQRATLEKVREMLREILPDATEEMSYAMPAFKIAGKAIAGYASFKNHCSYFPHSGNVLPEMADVLDGYDWDGGTLRFPVDQPLPKDLLERLVAVRMSQLGLSL